MVNSFPKDRDYRQEAMQAAAATAVTAMSKDASASRDCSFITDKAALFSIQYISCICVHLFQAFLIFLECYYSVIIVL